MTADRVVDGQQVPLEVVEARGGQDDAVRMAREAVEEPAEDPEDDARQPVLEGAQVLTLARRRRGA
jgi:hypothetical protein